MADPKSFLGRGISFPFKFTKRTGGVFSGGVVNRSENEQHITESILQIFGTRMGTRVMRRSFGSYVRELVFKPNDPALDPKIDYALRGAIERWEPRVIVGEMVIDRTLWREGIINVSITYTIIKTNVKRNLVFPFFLDPEEQKAWATDAQSTEIFG